jgi:hypothetical protein
MDAKGRQITCNPHPGGIIRNCNQTPNMTNMVKQYVRTVPQIHRAAVQMVKNAHRYLIASGSRQGMFVGKKKRSGNGYRSISISCSLSAIPVGVLSPLLRG